MSGAHIAIHIVLCSVSGTGKGKCKGVLIDKRISGNRNISDNLKFSSDITPIT